MNNGKDSSVTSRPLNDGVVDALKLRTRSGQLVDVIDPDPATILIEDIAHALSLLCRFGGHTKKFYSVAHHSILVAATLPEELKLCGLLHDAAEAYMVDLPRPIKRRLPDYGKAEDHLLEVIARKFGFAFPLPAEVVQMDEKWLRLEWRALMVGDWPSPIQDLPDVKGKFLELFYKYSK